jgi:hypothetical protein
MTATPGLLNGAREENTERMIAIAPPAPAIAAISEARITSFSRILDTLGSDNQEKSAPRIPQHLRRCAVRVNLHVLSFGARRDLISTVALAQCVPGHVTAETVSTVKEFGLRFYHRA